LAGYFLSKDQFVPGFPDLLTFARLIQKLICILIISMNRVVKYEHFEGYFVVLGENTVIFISNTPKFWFQKSVDERGLFSKLLPGYQRSTQTV